MSYRIVNTSLLIDVGCSLDLEELPFKNGEMNDSRFDALIVKNKKDKNGKKKPTKLLYRSGKIVIVGSKSIYSGRKTAERLVKKLIGFGVNAKLVNFEVTNIVICLVLPSIDVIKFATKYSGLEPELFPGVIHRLKRGKSE